MELGKETYTQRPTVLSPKLLQFLRIFEKLAGKISIWREWRGRRAAAYSKRSAALFRN